MGIRRYLLVALLGLGLAVACGPGEEPTDPAADCPILVERTLDRGHADGFMLPSTYTRKFVECAVGLYHAEGLDATLAYYNDPGSMEGSSYVFILRDGAIVAHAARPERLGLTTDDLIDVRGYHYGAEFAAVREGEGRWVTYWFRNPTTGREQKKHSWVVRVDGLLFGSGWYEGATT